MAWNGELGASKDIEDYDSDGIREGRILCPCHQAQFDIYDLARHVPGTPAPRPLPVLRIRIGTWTDEDGVHENTILGLEAIEQPEYRSADREGDGAPFQLHGTS